MIAMTTEMMRKRRKKRRMKKSKLLKRLRRLKNKMKLSKQVSKISQTQLKTFKILKNTLILLVISMMMLRLLQLKNLLKKLLFLSSSNHKLEILITHLSKERQRIVKLIPKELTKLIYQLSRALKFYSSGGSKGLTLQVIALLEFLQMVKTIFP